MSRRFFVKGLVPGIAFLAFALGAAVPNSDFHASRICVVAVRDSGLFTMCPSGTLIKTWRYPNRTESLEIIQNPEGPRLAVPRHIIQLDRPVLDRSRADWWNIVGRTPGSIPSGKLDPELKKAIEKELSRQSSFVLVDSPEQADLVFVAEGFYGDQISGFLGAQMGRYRSSGNPFLGLVLAIAVPAEAYLRFPADGGLLLNAKLWEGSVAWKSNPSNIDRQPASEPASLGNLIAQFADRENQKTSFPPLCAPRILVPSVDGLGMPRANPDINVGTNPSLIMAGNNSGAIKHDGVIRIDVSLVTVPAIVSDKAGKHVPDLSAKDFHLFENGVEQRIDRVIPEVALFNVVLMLDTSGSTVFKHSEIQNAALSFVEAVRPEERVMVVSFDSYIYLDSPFTSDHAALRRAILRTDTGAGTRLYDAMDLVLSECLNRVQGRKAIVLFTDGMDSQSWLARFGNNQNKVEESDALIYAVQYNTTGVARVSQYLSGLCQNSGGRLFIASTIFNLTEAFAGIADELQHQYTICYYPANQRSESQVRQIRVTVDSPNATIRARTGYRVANR